MKFYEHFIKLRLMEFHELNLIKFHEYFMKLHEISWNVINILHFMKFHEHVSVKPKSSWEFIKVHELHESSWISWKFMNFIKFVKFSIKMHQIFTNCWQIISWNFMKLFMKIFMTFFMNILWIFDGIFFTEKNIHEISWTFMKMFITSWNFFRQGRGGPFSIALWLLKSIKQQ
jgi:hypothetical protein